MPELPNSTLLIDIPVSCSNPDQKAVPLSQILKPQKLQLSDQGFDSPFTLAKYRANVRVVDYFPDKIEDFAVGYRATEFDMLSDYSGGEDTDLEEDRRLFRKGKGFRKDTWVWRFALKVADIDSRDSNDHIWLMVDNQGSRRGIPRSTVVDYFHRYFVK